MKTPLNVLIAVGIIIFGIIGFRILAGMQTEQLKLSRLSQVESVDATVVEFKTHKPRVIAYGRVVSQDPLSMTMDISGIIESGEVALTPGIPFRTGQILFKVNDDEAKLRFQAALSELLAAVANVLPDLKSESPAAAARFANYLEQSGMNRLIALPKVDDIKERLILNRFGVYRLYFQARQQEVVLQKHKWRAPYNGVITEVYMRPGSYVTQGSIVGKVGHDKNFEIEVQVPTDKANWIAPASAALVELEKAGAVHTSQVIRKNPVRDHDLNTSIYIGLPSTIQGKVKDGQFVEVVLEGRSLPNCLALPIKSLGTDENIWLVKNGRLEERKVSVLAMDREHVYLRGDLILGDTVVSTSMAGAISGTPIHNVQMENSRSKK